MFIYTVLSAFTPISICVLATITRLSNSGSPVLELFQEPHLNDFIIWHLQVSHLFPCVIPQEQEY